MCSSVVIVCMCVCACAPVLCKSMRMCVVCMYANVGLDVGVCLIIGVQRGFTCSYVCVRACVHVLYVWICICRCVARYYT